MQPTPERSTTVPYELHKSRSPESPAKPHTIDDYFSIANEIDFVRKVEKSIPVEDTRRYIEDDMYKFLGEFAGKVPYTTIKYKKTPGGFDFAGMNLNESYKRAAASGAREHAEWVGYDKIQQGFNEGKKTASWISPAKIDVADYGFVFHFQQDADPNWVTEYILRYDEKKGTTGVSQGILDKLAPDESYQTPEQFLYNPVVGEGFADPRRDLMVVLDAVGISQEDISRSMVYEATVRQMLSGRVDEYTDAILRGDEAAATKLRNGIFAAATEIAANLDKQFKGEPGYAAQGHRFATVSVGNKFNDDEVFFRTLGADELKIEGGSCPVVRKPSENPYSANNVLEALKNGTTPEQMAQKEWDYKIPGECNTCHVEYTEEAAARNEALGPCMMCKHCNDQYNEAGESVDAIMEKPLPR